MKHTFYLLPFVLFGLLILPTANAQNCADMPTGTADLTGNNISAQFHNGGDMFWDLSGSPMFEVPAGSDKHAIFAAATWMGGIDAQGQLRVAAQTYRQTGFDFFAGSIDSDGAVVCDGLDAIFSVSKAEVDEFIESDFSDPSDNIEQWPARNNPFYTDQGFDFDRDLAPFFDANADGDYNPADGDFPLVNGDNNLWYIYNDAAGTHTESGGQPLGVEVAAMAYSFNTDNFLNNAIFIDFELRYKADVVLNDFRFGYFVDPDLGDFSDDFVGCDPETNTGYVYNGDDFDSGANGFGEEVPALSVSFVKGVDDSAGNDTGLTGFLTYSNDFSATGNPETADHFNNYLNAQWKDGTSVTVGGNGYGGDEATAFMYSGSPANADEWSECSEANQPADRRFLMVSGGVTLNPGDVRTATVAIVFGESENFEYPCPDVPNFIDNYIDEAVATVDSVKAAQQSLITSVEPITSTEAGFSIAPNPADDLIELTFDAERFAPNVVEIWSVAGQIVSQQVLHRGERVVSLEGTPNGMYFVKLIDEQRGETTTRKLVVQR